MRITITADTISTAESRNKYDTSLFVSTQSQQQRYTFSSPYKQHFRLPFNYMGYILRHPTFPNGLLKLYKTCKYFFPKYQVLPVSGYNDSIMWQHVELNQCLKYKKTKKALLWFYETVIINKYFLPDFNQLCRCSPKKWVIMDYSLKLNDFELLVAEKERIESFYLWNSFIQSSNGDNLSIDIILQKLPYVKRFWFLWTFVENNIALDDAIIRIYISKSAFDEIHAKLIEGAKDFCHQLFQI